MTIQAELADGRVLEFPDGTDPAVIQSTVKRMIGVQDAGSVGVRDAGVVGDGDSGDSSGLSFPGAGIIEPALAIASGAIAEPIAGIAGTVAALSPLESEGAGGRTVEAVREALTFQPRTEAGQAGLQAVGEVIEPIATALTEAEQFLGDKTFEATGSPALAALAQTIPTALTEILGVAAGKGAVKATQKIKQARAKGQIIQEISEAAPSIDQLKDASRAVYAEIDELGVKVKPEAFNRLISQATRDAVDQGFDPQITPKATAALQRLSDLSGQAVSLSEIDNIRKVAQNAAKSLEPAEAAVGSRIIGAIDNYLDNIKPESFTDGSVKASDVGARYKAARTLWGRARRSELLEESFEKARNQASGFENGIRVQFRAILNNKKKSRFFTKEEKVAMTRVVRGDKVENIAKLIGRLGFSEGSATNILGGATGAAIGGAVGGVPGAVIVPVIGQVSRKLAQRMTVKNAEFADQVIRAGKDANKITEAYLKHTPKNKRSAAELSELLIKPDIDLSGLRKDALIQEAAGIAARQRGAAAGAIAPAGEER